MHQTAATLPSFRIRSLYCFARALIRMGTGCAISWTRILMMPVTLTP